MTENATTRWEYMSVDQKTKIVRKLANDGLSASAIAQKIPGDVSRNAVISHTHRYGIKLARAQKKRITADAPKKTAPAPKPVAKPPTKTIAAMPAITVVSARKIAPASVAPAGDRRHPFDPLPGVEPLSIIDLPVLGRCRWPVNGDGREALFCGCVTVPNTNVYCETHAQFARPKEAAHGKSS